MALAPANGKAAPETAADSDATPPAPARGGLGPWLPVLANLLLMPVLAYLTVSFLVLPKMVAARAPAATEGAASPANPGKPKLMVPLHGKILVNVAGTMGTRYLLASITLAGAHPDLKGLVEKNDAEMRDAAANALSVKTINDLEKPGARNLIRAELISVFNNILGQGVFTDLYLTEFAIQ